MLDCFCGMGGVSDGFALEGYDVMGIDIVDAPKLLGYKHKFIHADMMTLHGEDFKGFDVVWGSPPCRDFTRIADVYGHNWKEPPNPAKGLVLVRKFIDFVKKANPKFWILENVYCLKDYLSEISPNFVSYISIGKNNQGKKHVFYGNFPHFLLPRTSGYTISKRAKGPHGESWMRPNEGRIVSIQGKLRKWERAKIPLACSRAFAKACKEQLQ